MHIDLRTLVINTTRENTSIPVSESLTARTLAAASIKQLSQPGFKLLFFGPSTPSNISEYINTAQTSVF
ncbi:MAG: hypothetical protein ACRENG_38585, partial [bacterium]